MTSKWMSRPTWVGALTLALTQLAAANSTLNLTDTVTATGTGSGQTYNVYNSGFAANGTIVPTNTFSIGDSFNGTNLATGRPYTSTGTDFNISGTVPNVWNFQDDYAFSTSGATVQSVVIGLPGYGGTGLGDLQARIIYAAGNAAPTLGAPAGGTLVDSWQSVSSSAGLYNITMPTGIAGGSYILQVRGEAASGGGSYGGVLSFTAVPLPAALPLLLSGIAGVGVFARRRKLVVA
jgi:hypothetical protein